ncbi:hypothetical protein B0H13DRAFT_500824 [Mycena leptocephala]|nr:hypothetical protein B0H13DRAFT_500824 [Mycena leptocephala]
MSNMRWSALSNAPKPYIYFQSIYSFGRWTWVPILMLMAKLTVMKAADSYWVKTTGASFFLLPGTVWIRPSTGKLCLDIGDGDEQCMNLWPALTGFVFAPLPSLKLTENELHNKLLHALKFDEFYIMFAHDTDHFYNFPSSAEAIKLPSILILSDCVNFKSHQLLTIPFPNHFTPDEIHMLSWTGFRLKNKVMPTGWTRVKYLDIPYENFGLLMSVGVHEKKEVIKWWLSQHSFVRKHLQSVIGTDVPLHFITKINFNCYLDTDNFTLRGTFMTDAPSKEVYLFLFPPQVEILDGQFIVTNPLDAEKYYWAFDPTGLDRLTDEIAEEIGLPTPEFSIDLRGSCWDATIIHEFLAAKAFDPDSQDAAIAMGYPLVDIEAMKRFAQELTGKHSIDCQDEEDDDGIYYSLALC